MSSVESSWTHQWVVFTLVHRLLPASLVLHAYSASLYSDSLSSELHLTLDSMCQQREQPWTKHTALRDTDVQHSDSWGIFDLRLVSWGQTEYHIIQQSDGLPCRLVILYLLQHIKALQHIWEGGIAVTDKPFYVVISDGLNAWIHVSSA